MVTVGGIPVAADLVDFEATYPFYSGWCDEPHVHMYIIQYDYTRRPELG